MPNKADMLGSQLKQQLVADCKQLKNFVGDRGLRHYLYSSMGYVPFEDVGLRSWANQLKRSFDYIDPIPATVLHQTEAMITSQPLGLMNEKPARQFDSQFSSQRHPLYNFRRKRQLPPDYTLKISKLPGSIQVQNVPLEDSKNPSLPSLPGFNISDFPRAPALPAFPGFYSSSGLTGLSGLPSIPQPGLQNSSPIVPPLASPASLTDLINKQPAIPSIPKSPSIPSFIIPPGLPNPENLSSQISNPALSALAKLPSLPALPAHLPGIYSKR